MTSTLNLLSVWYTAFSRFTCTAQPSRLAAMLCSTFSLWRSPAARAGRISMPDACYPTNLTPRCMLCTIVKVKTKTALVAITPFLL